MGLMSRAGNITCYACQHEYSYLGGDGHHPGVCPACGEQAVSPSGEFTLQDAETIELDTSIAVPKEYRRICGTDESGREFQWWFAVSRSEAVVEAHAETEVETVDDDGPEATLLRVLVAGKAVTQDNVVGSELVPLRKLLSKLDRVSCDPRGVEEATDESF